MDHRQLEKEILHLENVIGRISAADGIPISYWRNRVGTVASTHMLPSQKMRLKRIDDRLAQIESSD
jgi:hypothetical protein